jgi:hypothetical protein
VTSRVIENRDAPDAVIQYVERMEEKSPNLLIIDHLYWFLNSTFPTMKKDKKKELAVMGMDWAITIRSRKRKETYREMEAKMREKR